ncbi:PAS domain-containing protein [Synergistaceae bacterium OttesenSCG-928-I11]|nr:PAS domain-containing protein [Synergistaceae bacterium OttesenSCG-928-I11]
MSFDSLPDMHPQLRPYAQIVKGLAEIFGDDCEILLHDVSRLERSIVACANGHLTGRPLGSPMSVYGLELLNSEKFSDCNTTYTYMARTNSGALIKCGVISLRDEAGQMIGLLCVHFDAARAQVAKQFIDRFFSVSANSEPEPVNEFFGLEIEDIFKNTMQEVKIARGKPLRELSKSEKKEVVRSLIDKGFFMMKGAVDYVAGEMGNSKFTVYAYMREVEKETAASKKTGEEGGAGA